MPFSCINERKWQIKKHAVFPINPGEYHGAYAAMTEISLLGVEIEPNRLSELAYYSFGESKVVFENGSHQVKPGFYRLIQEFIAEVQTQAVGHQFMLDSLSVEICMHILRNVKSNLAAQKRVVPERRCIQKAIEYIYAKYAADFSLNELANEANLSQFYFIRSFKEQTGKTPYEFLLDIRIEKACEMLREKEMKVAEICYLSGFNNQSHFTSVFKRKVGISPSRYRAIL